MAGANPLTGLLKRPATPAPLRRRKNVQSLPINDPIMAFYGRAIREMTNQPITNPVSWRYQAAIHDYTRDTDPFSVRAEDDPNARLNEPIPSVAEQRRFWRQCNHQSWYFLPWHRMYLHHFERIVMGHVARLGGPTDWALPYWNYSSGAADATLLPIHFRRQTLDDGSPNPSLSGRETRAPMREPRFASTGPGSQTDTSASLSEGAFASSGGSAGFGGPRTVFNHSGGAPFGTLEGTPHGPMHMAVAGPPVADPSSPSGAVRRGFMGNFVRAPLDPIFWLHHCNIDRLWKVWLRDPAHTNPTTADWLTSVKFPFHDAAGAIVEMVPSEVLETRNAPLGYVYDDEP